MEKLGGPAFVPNPLASPALMVLASTAEAARSSSPSTSPMNDYHAIYSSPSSRYLDGEAVHRMVLSSGSFQHRAPHFALYPGAEHFPERVPQDFGPHYLQIHHHLSSSLLHKANGPAAVFNGTGAFRRVGVPEHGFPFYPYQHQRSLLERERVLAGEQYKNSEHSSESNSTETTPHERVSPHRRERRDSSDTNLSPQKICSPENDESNVKFELKKEMKKESKCCDEESGTNEDRENVDRSLEIKKKKGSSSHPPSCPICGITIRPGEMDSHFAWEIERVHEENKKVRKSQRDLAAQARKNVLAPSGSKRPKQEGRNPIPNDDTPASTRHQTYLRVCANRMTRNGRPLRSTRSRSSQSSPLPQDGESEEGPSASGIKSVLCPVCGETIHGRGEELDAHVEACLRKRGGDSEEINGKEQATGEFLEYEWAGQTRIRATALMEGGFRASGFQTGQKRKSEEDDADLNIDGDDAEEYGKAQYTEADIIPCNLDEPEENRARQALRGAVLSGENSPVSKNSLTRNRWSEDEKEQGTEEDKNTDGEKTEGTGDGDLVMSSLKSRIKELEKRKSDKIKCLICMEPYSMPLVSISCWHVHCEECWLRSLGVKKLCPQCNMITSPTDLRRIFL